MPSAKTAIAKWGSSEKLRMAPAIGVHEPHMKENANVQVTWSGGSESARTLFLPTITRLAIGIYICICVCMYIAQESVVAGRRCSSSSFLCRLNHYFFSFFFCFFVA